MYLKGSRHSGAGRDSLVYRNDLGIWAPAFACVTDRDTYLAHRANTLTLRGLRLARLAVSPDSVSFSDRIIFRYGVYGLPTDNGRRKWVSDASTDFDRMRSLGHLPLNLKARVFQSYPDNFL